METTISREQEITELVEKLEAAISAYNAGIPILEDAEFDALLLQLESLDPQHPLLDEVTGEDVADFDVYDSILKNYKMYSIKPLYNQEDIMKKVLYRKEYNVSFKEDGFGIRVVYVNGKYHSAFTRGRNTKGKDITERVRHLFPKEIERLKGLTVAEVRGELQLSKAEFESLKQAYPHKEFVVSTTTISSLLGDDMPIEETKRLAFKAYNYLSEDMESFEFTTQAEVYEALKSDGFDTPPYEVVDIDDPDDLMEVVDRMGQNSLTYEFKTDGLVFMFNDLEEFYSAPTSKKYRESAFAVKFGVWQSQIYQAKIEKIVWSKGRHGYLVPKAEITPLTSSSGKTVTVVSLHNPTTILQHDIGVGDILYFEYVGEINPKFVGIAEHCENREVHVNPVLETANVVKRAKENLNRQTTTRKTSTRVPKVSLEESLEKLASIFDLES